MSLNGRPDILRANLQKSTRLTSEMFDAQIGVKNNNGDIQSPQEMPQASAILLASLMRAQLLVKSNQFLRRCFLEARTQS